MAVPRHKHTRSSVGQRRMHIFIKPASLTVCKKCNRAVRPHTVCRNCGYYKGQEFINVLGKLTKKEKKLREKEMQKAEKEQKKTAPATMEELSKK
ncbi:MAG: 50S ribosomal protein L32 [Candidatus Staskawiczbacteria bacterium RIFCSPLOWO2_01_FULL_40_39]|uniref:Large ribosomal subunit protein bL32 n=1 Tax=Candidatus Staskawiczbacteria bacterium RIFCSPHIGHO2_01_FULL_39_25 TaxID=1802202 RepID=A0A1G2HQ63_9BACT|nr:MAG: 50S ribosomal protein L32 [Candidatus Staskawiczbacteria bacterium RIFCSPHIGHO2_01_FULL_39_25]OGZ72860.1 MAG: 50S ribosomal protein L32 [Candidatus Staskawiczbacteria bacterium RIFCSPLOWO2_01_FULL_40_39]OGZ75215.1 MAG: 50S ribosomal protein L32 [Candidatus Staskawiczbacteria bacterium RIFCSPLOWO2_02_FULL_39_8]